MDLGTSRFWDLTANRWTFPEIQSPQKPGAPLREIQRIKKCHVQPDKGNKKVTNLNLT